MTNISHKLFIVLTIFIALLLAGSAFAIIKVPILDAAGNPAPVGDLSEAQINLAVKNLAQEAAKVNVDFAKTLSQRELSTRTVLNQAEYDILFGKLKSFYGAPKVDQGVIAGCEGSVCYLKIPDKGVRARVAATKAAIGIKNSATQDVTITSNPNAAGGSATGGSSSVEVSPTIKVETTVNTPSVAELEASQNSTIKALAEAMNAQQTTIRLIVQQNTELAKAALENSLKLQQVNSETVNNSLKVAQQSVQSSENVSKAAIERPANLTIGDGSTATVVQGSPSAQTQTVGAGGQANQAGTVGGDNVQVNISSRPVAPVAPPTTTSSVSTTPPNAAGVRETIIVPEECAVYPSTDYVPGTKGMEVIPYKPMPVTTTTPKVEVIETKLLPPYNPPKQLTNGPKTISRAAKMTLALLIFQLIVEAGNALHIAVGEESIEYVAPKLVYVLDVGDVGPVYEVNVPNGKSIGLKEDKFFVESYSSKNIFAEKNFLENRLSGAWKGLKDLSIYNAYMDEVANAGTNQEIVSGINYVLFNKGSKIDEGSCVRTSELAFNCPAIAESISSGKGKGADTVFFMAQTNPLVVGSVIKQVDSDLKANKCNYLRGDDSDFCTLYRGLVSDSEVDSQITAAKENVTKEFGVLSSLWDSVKNTYYDEWKKVGTSWKDTFSNKYEGFLGRTSAGSYAIVHSISAACNSILYPFGVFAVAPIVTATAKNKVISKFESFRSYEFGSRALIVGLPAAVHTTTTTNTTAYAPSSATGYFIGTMPANFPARLARVMFDSKTPWSPLMYGDPNFVTHRIKVDGVVVSSNAKNTLVYQKLFFKKASPDGNWVVVMNNLPGNLSSSKNAVWEADFTNSKSVPGGFTIEPNDKAIQPGICYEDSEIIFDSKLNDWTCVQKNASLGVTAGAKGVCSSATPTPTKDIVVKGSGCMADGEKNSVLDLANNILAQTNSAKSTYGDLSNDLFVWLENDIFSKGLGSEEKANSRGIVADLMDKDATMFDMQKKISYWNQVAESNKKQVVELNAQIAKLKADSLRDSAKISSLEGDVSDLGDVATAYQNSSNELSKKVSVLEKEKAELISKLNLSSEQTNNLNSKLVALKKAHGSVEDAKDKFSLLSTQLTPFCYSIADVAPTPAGGGVDLSGVCSNVPVPTVVVNAPSLSATSPSTVAVYGPDNKKLPEGAVNIVPNNNTIDYLGNIFPETALEPSNFSMKFLGDDYLDYLTLSMTKYKDYYVPTPSIQDNVDSMLSYQNSIASNPFKDFIFKDDSVSFGGTNLRVLTAYVPEGNTTYAKYSKIAIMTSNPSAALSEAGLLGLVKETMKWESIKLAN